MTDLLPLVLGGVLLFGILAFGFTAKRSRNSDVSETSAADLRVAKDKIAGAPTIDAMCAEAAHYIDRLVGSRGAFVSVDGTEARSGQPFDVDSETMTRLAKEQVLVEQKSIAAIPVIHAGDVVGLVAADGSDHATLSALGRYVNESYSQRHAKPTRFSSGTARVDFDGLTGVGNRRRFDSDLAGVVATADDPEVPVSLAMFDIDDFRYYNDAHGKHAGNNVLRSVAELIASNLRETDVVYRYSGVKFVALLPGATVENGYSVVERVRQAVESTSFEGAETQPTGRVTMSIGIAEAASGHTDNLIEAADAALVSAKESGRNKVVIEADIR